MQKPTIKSLQEKIENLRITIKELIEERDTSRGEVVDAGYAKRAAEKQLLEVKREMEKKDNEIRTLERNLGSALRENEMLRAESHRYWRVIQHQLAPDADGEEIL